jgi:hypothetical protein
MICAQKSLAYTERILLIFVEFFLLIFVEIVVNWKPLGYYYKLHNHVLSVFLGPI